MKKINAFTRPVQLLETKQDGEFIINIEALKYLEKIKSSIQVVSCVGGYRTGKSFLLNGLLGFSGGGFQVGDELQGCTYGVWMFLKQKIDPITRKEKILVVLDFEGCGDTSNEDIDMKLYAVALSLSCLMIVNSKSVINESDISSLADAIKYISASGDVVLPKLLFVIRDFTLHARVIAEKYLESILYKNTSDINRNSDRNVRG